MNAPPLPKKGEMEPIAFSHQIALYVIENAFPTAASVCNCKIFGAVEHSDFASRA